MAIGGFCDLHKILVENQTDVFSIPRAVIGATTHSFTIPLSLLCYKLIDIQKDSGSSHAIGCLLLGFVVVTKIVGTTKQATCLFSIPLFGCARAS